MYYDIEIDAENEIIKLTSDCLLTQGIRREILLATESQLGVTNFKRVLIDLTKTTFDPGEPMSGALELANFMRTLGIKPQVKFAFIYSEAESHRKYFENVAKLDGFDIRYFKSAGEALEWLKE